MDGCLAWLVLKPATKTPRSTIKGPSLTQEGGTDYGYHVWDTFLARDNLVSDVIAAEITWTRDYP